MLPLVSTIEIARPPGEVFGYATDPRNFATWQKDVVSVQMTDSPCVVGSRFTTVRRFAGMKREIEQVITECIPPLIWSSKGIGGPVKASATISIEPIHSGTGSRVTFALSFDGHGAGRALLPIIRRQAEKGAPISYQNLKSLLESAGT